MKIGTVARLLDVPVPTLRRWTQEFAALLSPAARSRDGAVREFTHEDVMLLRKAHDLLRQDKSFAAVRRELGVPDPNDPPDVASSPQSNGPANDEEREVATRFVRAILEEELTPLYARLDLLEQYIKELQQRSADTTTRSRWPFHIDR
ncbi:MAG: MerR family transcriptional regulator [Chloroflexi bacterium]|nr:MerR family transcriptional regulator [Chloroflexota bacterium]